VEGLLVFSRTKIGHFYSDWEGLLTGAVLRLLTLSFVNKFWYRHALKARRVLIWRTGVGVVEGSMKMVWNEVEIEVALCGRSRRSTISSKNLGSVLRHNFIKSPETSLRVDMAPSPIQQRRTHNTLLFQKLLSLRDGASPFTLVLDTLEQSGGPIVREFARRAKVCAFCHWILLYNIIKDIKQVRACSLTFSFLVKAFESSWKFLGCHVTGCQPRWWI
jgi:hypothetical protein